MNRFFSNYRYQLRTAGTWLVRVKACSLAGCGRWNEGQEVSVNQKSNAYLLYVILIPVLVVVLIITVLASGFVFVKYKANNGPEITPNVIYHNIVRFLIIYVNIQ